MKNTHTQFAFAIGDLVKLHSFEQNSVLMLRDGVDIEDIYAWVLIPVGTAGVVMQSYILPAIGLCAYTVQFGHDRVTSVFERELRAVV